MLSFAFSMSNLMRNEDVLIRRIDEFLDAIGGVESEDGKKGINIVQKFNYATFNVMGEMSFGDSWDLRLKEQRGQSSPLTRQQTFMLTPLGEHRYHWADVIVNTTYMNDVMRAVVCIPGLFSLLERFPPTHSKRTLYRHAEYATEHTEAYIPSPILQIR